MQRQGTARGIWKSAIQQVQDINRQQREASLLPQDSLSAECLGSTPSIIEQHQWANTSTPASPKLAIMVHAAHNVPGSLPSSSCNSGGPTSSSSTDKASSLCYYVRAGLHASSHPLKAQQKQKTQAVRVGAGGGAEWPEGLLQLEPHGELSQLDVVLQLKCRGRLGSRAVVLGVVRVALQEVVGSRHRWGSKQHLTLTGHKAEAAGTTLEVQLFLSASSVPSPLRVLCATWNVGNALPPPPEQLQAWMKGVQEGEHHLVAVAAQECNYMREMRRFVTQQRKSVTLPSAAEYGTSTPTAAAAAAAGSTLPSAAGGITCTAEKGPLTPTAQAQAREVEAAVAAAAAAGAVTDSEADAAVLQPRLASTRAVLKSRLVDAVDSSAMWERLISSALGDQYWLVCSKHMFQTRLLLFARADIVPSISHISSGFEATGIGRVGVNKGGVGIGLQVGSTHIAFVGSHLAAHQSKIQQRNRDVAEICKELDLSKSSAAAGSDLVTGFHHVVWMGDLNYRLEYGQQAETQADSPTPEDFASQCELITQQRFDELLPLDQLRRERDAGHVYAGFSEGPITFAPTFKVHKGELGFSYAAKRSPAWCDRVLFKSLLSHKQASCDSYYTVADIVTSDHKPVAAMLSLPMATRTVTGAHSSSQAQPGAASVVATPPHPSSPGGSKPITPVNSWGSAAASTLAKLSRISRRNSTPNASALFRLRLTSLCVADIATWDRLALLASKTTSPAKPQPDSSVEGSRDPVSGTSKHTSAADNGVQLDSSNDSRGQVKRSSSSGAGRSTRQRLRLHLLVTGACLSGVKQEHVIKLDHDAVDTARASVEQPSLLLREESIQLLPGPLSQLTDDWLLLQLVLSDGWRRKQTLARGVLPLQPVVSAYRSSLQAVAVPLQLEVNSAVVGNIECKVQLIDSASIRAGMYEAIRRMRTMAASRTSSLTDATSL